MSEEPKFLCFRVQEYLVFKEEVNLISFRSSREAVFQFVFTNEFNTFLFEQFFKPVAVLSL